MRDLLLSLENRERIWIPCPIKTIFGIRCPGCGMTHALVALLRGDLRRAMHFNPFVLVLAPLLLLGLIDLAQRVVGPMVDYLSAARRPAGGK